MTASDLPGTYFADYGFAKEILELSSNRSFVQKIKVSQSGEIVTSHGTWWFVPGDSDVCFSVDFLVVSDGFGRLAPDFAHPATRAISILPVRQRLGKVQVGLDPRVPYRKYPPDQLPQL